MACSVNLYTLLLQLLSRISWGKKWKIFMWIYIYVLAHKILPRRKGGTVLFEQLL